MHVARRRVVLERLVMRAVVGDRAVHVGGRDGGVAIERRRVGHTRMAGVLEPQTAAVAVEPSGSPLRLQSVRSRPETSPT